MAVLKGIIDIIFPKVTSTTRPKVPSSSSRQLPALILGVAECRQHRPAQSCRIDNTALRQHDYVTRDCLSYRSTWKTRKRPHGAIVSLSHCRKTLWIKRERPRKVMENIRHKRFSGWWSRLFGQSPAVAPNTLLINPYDFLCDVVAIAARHRSSHRGCLSFAQGLHFFGGHASHLGFGQGAAGGNAHQTKRHNALSLQGQHGRLRR